MSASISAFKFKNSTSNGAEFSVTQDVRDHIVGFLEYAAEADLVYYEAMVAYDVLLDLIQSIKSKDISQGALELSQTEFWQLHVMYQMHSDITDEVSDFPKEGFFEVFNELDQARDKVLTKRSEAG